MEPRAVNAKLQYHISDRVQVFNYLTGKEEYDIRTKEGEKVLYAASSQVVTYYDGKCLFKDPDGEIIRSVKSSNLKNWGTYSAELCGDKLFIYSTEGKVAGILDITKKEEIKNG